MKKNRIKPIAAVLAFGLAAIPALTAPASAMQVPMDGTPAAVNATAAAPADSAAENVPAEQNSSLRRLTAVLEHSAGELLNERYDYYFTYYTADEYRTMSEDYVGSFGGVGITMTSGADSNVVVYNILDHGPARSADIQVGDIIVAVDGQNMLGKTSSDAAPVIRGEIGTQVTITLRREGRGDFDVTLTREQITATTVSAEMIEEAPGTAYFRISEFTTQTVTEFVTLYNTLKAEHEIYNIIFDLRSNGGGAFSAAINLANYFVPNGETIVSESTPDGVESYTGNSGILRYCRVYILQNRWSASSSEVLTGALRDRAGAVTIGTTSYGKGITQLIVNFRDGRALRYTHSRYYTPSGYDLHGIGIPADVETEMPEVITSAQYYSTDPAQNPDLAAALELINSEDN